MTNNEIYNRAIEKIANSKIELFFPRLIVDREELFDFEIHYIIFSHEFAKAYWGEELVIIDNHGSKISNWENELMQMVLEKEPLKYLAQYLDKT